MKNDNLILINSDNPITKSFKPSDLVPFSNKYLEHLLKLEARDKLMELISFISGEKLIIPISGYRTYDEQKILYRKSLLKNGFEYTKKFVALEGHSEHQTGFAIDLGLNTDDNNFISPSFKDHPIVDSFIKYMGDFGFILRYPEDKTHITKIAYEPWHFRYVGVKHSKLIIENNLSLEEYIYSYKDIMDVILNE